MVDKSRALAIVLFASVTWMVVPAARAVDPPDLYLDHLADFLWTGSGGNNTWENAANWTAPTFPVDYPYTIPTYPDDPGRVDPADEISVKAIFPVVGANLSKALASDLTVNLANGNITIASLKLGGTTAAVTTNVTATAPTSRLIFENQERNDTLTNPGDPNAMPPILPEPIYGFNQGRPLIWSTGTPGVGKENKVSVGVQMNDGVDVEGDRDLHFYGEMYEGVVGRESSVNSLLSNGAKVYIHTNINLEQIDDDLEAEGIQDRAFAINREPGIMVPADPQMPPTNPSTRQGVVDISGKFVGNGFLEIGAPDSARLPLGSVILRADNVGADSMAPTFSGRLIINRGNLVLANDKAFGGASNVLTGNPNTAVGFNFISDDDNRKIANNITIAQWHTIRGATGIAGLEDIGDHSIEFSGRITQTNSRGFINLLPAGKTLTISGPQYGLENQANTNLDHHRPYTIDGSGKTLITGGIHNRVPEQADAGLVDFRKRGSGTVIIDYNEANLADTPSDYMGNTYVDGGNLHFAQATDLPNATSPQEIISTSGAVGLDSGLFTAGGALTADGTTFLNMLNNSANLNAPDSQVPGSFLRLYGVNDVIFNRYDTGGLMLGAGDYNKNVDFSGSQASNPLARAANMTLAAHEGGSTYTGTITPASFSNGSPQPGATNPTGIPVSPDTYRLGGGSGVLTLPNNNQLVNGTVNRSLLVANGGEVKLMGTHTYSGVTRIQRASGTTLQLDAARDDPADDPNLDPNVNPATRVSTTLTVMTLANGGQASSIGNATSDAANLVVQGGTLMYVGGAVSTNRLFTIGTAGGTIDASGSGPLTFSSTSALGIGTAGVKRGYIVGSLPNSGNNEVLGVPGVIPTGLSEIIPLDTSDLVSGMTVTNTSNQFGTPLIQDDDSNLVITGVGMNLFFIGETDLTADNESSTEPPAPWAGYSNDTLDVATFQIGPAPARFLALAGTNADNNTLNPLVTDASDIGISDGALGGKGSVGIRKQGIGKWVVTANNTYSGATNVDAGTLLINGTQTGAGLTTVSNGASFGGTGQIGGNLTMLEGSIFTAAATGGGLDSLHVLGNVDLSAVGNALNVTGITSGTHTLLTFAGTLLGTFESTPGFDVNYLANSITITKIANALIGDYNNNGTVDAADYTIWRNNVGNAGSTLGANRDPANGAGVVTSADYNSWKKNFGAQLGAGSLGVGSVPEPTTLVLVAISLGFVAGIRRRAG